MKFEYFGDIDNLGALFPVLKKYDEKQLLQYEPFSRTQMCAEIQELCFKFKQPPPEFLAGMLEDPNAATEKALKLGYDPEKPLIDQINDQYGLNLQSPSDLAGVLFQKDTAVSANVTDEEDSDSIDDEEQFVKAALNQNTK